jgi:hypothetical protein
MLMPKIKANNLKKRIVDDSYLFFDGFLLSYQFLCDHAGLSNAWREATN